MKKISLVAAAVLASSLLAACGNQASSHKASKSATSSSKVVHHKHHKKQNHKKKAASSSSSSSSSAQSSSNNQQQSQSKQANPADESTWNLPYKGFSSYNAYIEYYHGDPDVQRQTAQMQHDENVREGIEDANGNETQNFKNWVAARDNDWNNGDDNFPDYGQNRQW